MNLTKLGAGIFNAKEPKNLVVVLVLLVIYGMLKFDTLAASNFSYFKEDIPTPSEKKIHTKNNCWHLDFGLLFSTSKTNHESDGRWEDGGWGPQPATITLQVMLIMMTHSKQILGESLSIISKTRLIVLFCSGEKQASFYLHKYSPIIGLQFFEAKSFKL